MSNTMDFVPSPIPPAALAELEALIDETVINGDTVHRIDLAPDGREDPTVAKAGTAAANSARRMLDRGTRTWALVDPADPRRCLWIEGWSIESIGD